MNGYYIATTPWVIPEKSIDSVMCPLIPKQLSLVGSVVTDMTVIFVIRWPVYI
jgi:hypothetical protein